MQRSETPSFRAPAPIAALVLGAALALAAGPALAQSRVVGEVGSVSGLALAQTPGQQPRELACGDPIYAGDRVVTSERSSLGVVSGDFWTGLGPETETTFADTAAGAPQVDLAKGHLRVIDASAAAPAPAAIYTPGLVALDSGTDTEALVFGEKVGTVAMICGWDQAIDVDGRGASTGSLITEPGECAIGKPREKVYGAPATHEPLPVSANDACGAGRPFDVAGHHFLPAVAAGVAPTLPAGPTVAAFAGFGPASCQITGCGGAARAAAPAPPPAVPGVVFGPPRRGAP
jgi:hypothetical protein